MNLFLTADHALTILDGEIPKSNDNLLALLFYIKFMGNENGILHCPRITRERQRMAGKSRFLDLLGIKVLRRNWSTNGKVMHPVSGVSSGRMLLRPH
jgi:hypothetical protein